MVEKTKSVWASKTVWAAGLFFIIALLKANNVDQSLGIVIPWEVLQAALGSLGLYGLRDAVTTGKKLK